MSDPGFILQEITLTKRDGMLGIDLTYGTDTLQGALFVHSIKPGSPAEMYGRPLLHDQIVKVCAFFLKLQN